MRAAELQIERLAFPEDNSAADEHLDPRAALKQQVSERLAAHRSRRSRRSGGNLVAIAEPSPQPAKARASRIVSAVAERYAQTPSYRDFLASEAARAIEEAHAAAEVAARNAEAVTLAQQQLLAELDLWDEPRVEAAPAPDHVRAVLAAAPEESRQAPAPERTIQHPFPGLTVRLFEDAGVRPPVAAAPRIPQGAAPIAAPDEEEEEKFLLDDEIAFRQTPVFPEPSGPPTPIPANLIEFPRQLVAPRKARPRIAEGPLREEADAGLAAAQLRIFEVEPGQISTDPNAGVETVVPEWSSIHLDAAPVSEPLPQASQEPLHAQLLLETASLGRRAMAAAVDGCLLGAAFLGAVAVFASSVTVLPAWPVAAAAAAATLLVLFVLYHVLFFTFADQTPGMRYARIGLCTFADENPTRAEMRRRTWAVLLSACPLGIGFLWALLDDEGLGWHDRISRMYQRAY